MKYSNFILASDFKFSRFQMVVLLLYIVQANAVNNNCESSILTLALVITILFAIVNINCIKIGYDVTANTKLVKVISIV